MDVLSSNWIGSIGKQVGARKCERRESGRSIIVDHIFDDADRLTRSEVGRIDSHPIWADVIRRQIRSKPS